MEDFCITTKSERQRRTSLVYFAMFSIYLDLTRLGPLMLHISLGLNSMFLTALLIRVITHFKADYF